MNSDPDGASPEREGATRRRLRRLAYLLLALAGFYLVAVNLFLNTDLAPWAINRKPEKFLVQWERGRTLIPGWTRLDDVRLRVQSKKAQWTLEVDSVRVRHNPLTLLVKRFDVGKISATGVVFRLRRRLEPGEEPGFAPPPIDGLENPPAVPPEVLYPGPKPPRGWILNLGHAVAEEVREIWIEDHRFQGDGRASGRVSYQVRGAFALDGAQAQLKGDITIGESVSAREVEAAIEAGFEKFVLRQNRGLAKLRFLSGRLRLDSPEIQLSALDPYFRDASWFTLGGSGRLSADLRLEDGTPAAESQIEIEGASLEVDTLRHFLRGRGELRGHVEQRDGRLVSSLEGHLQQIELGLLGGDPLPLRSEKLVFRVESPGFNLHERPHPFDLVVDLTPSEVTDLRALNAYLPASAGLAFVSGVARMKLHAELSSRPGGNSGEFKLAGQRLKVSYDGVEMLGDLDLSGRLSSAELGARRFQLNGTQVEISEVEVLGSPDGAKKWWLRLDIPEGELRATDRVELDARFKARLLDSRPFIALAMNKKPILRWLEPLLVIEDLSAAGDLHLVDDDLALRSVTVEGDGLEARADLRFFGKGPEGALYFKRGVVSAAVALDRASGREWKFFKALSWYEEQIGSQP